MIPVTADLPCIDVDLVVSSISPIDELNQLGGDELTLTGTGFDSDILDTTVVFSDDTVCIVNKASSTELKCTVDGFDLGVLDISNGYLTNVTVNEVSHSDHTVMVKSTK